jgi:hypothetical protein
MLRAAAGVLLVAVVGVAPVAAREPAASRPVARVLLVGNSYTYFNNLGDLLAGIAASNPKAPAIDPVLVVRGGATLRWHLDHGPALDVLASRRWDFVVLQEQSLLGGGTVGGRPVVGDPSAFHAAVREWVRRIRAAGATPVLYMTWARRDASTRPDEMQRQLADAYSSIGRELGVPVAPVGLAWAEARRRHAGVALHVEDGSHPTPAGSYLAACVLLATLTGVSPVGAPGVVRGHPPVDLDDMTVVDPDRTVTLVDLDGTTAAALQRVAVDVTRAGAAPANHEE